MTHVSFDRRTFLKLVGGTCAVSTLESCTYAEVFTQLDDGYAFDLSDPAFEPLKTVGEAVSIDGGGRKLVLIRVSDQEIVALNRICTHASCDMSLNGTGSGQWDGEKLICLCHQSWFSPQGEVLQGPAPRPLTRYDVSFNLTDERGSINFTGDDLEAGAQAGAEPPSNGEIPDEYRDLVNELAGDEDAIQEGRTLFEQNCQFCHGEAGVGGLVPGAVAFNVDQSQWSDGHFFWKISEGVSGTAMAAYKDQLSEEQIWQIISYLRTLEP